MATRTLTVEAARRIPPRPWWETWWCIALALLLVAAPSLAAGVTSALSATPVLMAAAMLWLSRVAHGRIQPSAYFALPFADRFSTPGPTLTLAGFVLWLRLARWPWPRAAAFVALSGLIYAADATGWLCLLATVFAAELARERAVEREGLRRPWSACGWRAARACLPLAPPVLMLPTWRMAGPDDWLASLALKPGWLTMALGNRWPVFDAACMIVVALVAHKSYRDRRFVHAPMLVAAALALLLVFIAAPAGLDSTIAPGAIALALLSIRCNARVKLRRRGEVAWAALAFLAIRGAAGVANMDAHDFGAAVSQAGLSHPPAAR
ncbi:hypothetical protein PX554_07525 [Sphingomonas sp. H39-1-10]|uniref:hypothetical protein n=1 Tax=Sphingomonas pollutisoli TaxID=3030829 RepID=UPI0023B9BF36|nr:hypothetical protein [Sphingomonas pollutisoli]MDF0487977.1 hypothetical protein [Sphingomonas pollutisoli]